MRPEMAKADLRRVERAARSLEQSRDEFLAAILAARASGETLRDIAEAAGVSHQWISQLANKRRSP